jgi:hypothetical protein
MKIGFEGGACMFSLEENGEPPDSAPSITFKGLGLGTPLGMFPYEIFPASSDFDARFDAALSSFDLSPFRNRRIDLG